MGIGASVIQVIMRSLKSSDTKGGVLTLGRQCVKVTFEELNTIASKMNFTLHTVPNIEMSQCSKNSRFISDKTLFEALGFSRLESIDYSDYEGASIVHDMNYEIDSSLHSQFDFIVDSGTTEHIYNIYQSHLNIHNLLKVGGVVIHHLPSNGAIDHGFYQFSPTLFEDMYVMRGYEKITVLLHLKNNDKLFYYENNQIGHYMMKKAVYILACATKSEKSNIAIPQQGYYSRNRWTQDADTQQLGKAHKNRKTIDLIEQLSPYILHKIKRAYSQIVYYRQNMSKKLKECDPHDLK